ncbi:MAG TPA: hypothetical protein VH639_26055 [Bryobacteraceae bacterium]|jgi:hypothetical protein
MNGILETSARSRSLSLAILCLSLAIGGWLRFSGLADKSMSHPEIYVPGIRLPEGISEPAERDTVVKVLTGTFSSDTHPPGYYLAMFPWTRVMGTNLGAIRLPSAILGWLCIPLVYALGAMMGRPLSGSLAALLLAASGYHVFWSHVARMFAQACFLGLAATVLLLWIARGARRQALLGACYIALILAGAATHVFFWTLFATHIVWAFARARSAAVLPGICRAQLLGLILGSPLIAFLAYQSGNTVAELSGNGLQFLAAYIPFAFMLPTADSGFFPATVPLTGSALAWTFRGLLLAAGAFLLLAGWRAAAGVTPDLAAPEEGKNPPGRQGLWRLGWIAAAVASTFAILAFIYMTRYLDAGQLHETIRATRILTGLPFLLTVVAIFVDRLWSRLPPPGNWVARISTPLALPALLAVLPFGLLASASLIRPLLNQRGLLFTAPYLLLLVSAGLLSLRARTLRIALGLVAGIGCAAGISSYASMNVGPVDYGKLAAGIAPEIQPDDLVFIHKAWYATPLFYYLTPGRYRLVGRDFNGACANNPNARVWVVLIDQEQPGTDISGALASYRLARTVQEPDGRALLYQRAAP